MISQQPLNTILTMRTAIRDTSESTNNSEASVTSAAGGNFTDATATSVSSSNSASIGVTTTASADSSVAKNARQSSPAGAEQKLPFPVVLWKFTRPHTLIGSAAAIPAISLLAAPSMAAVLKPRALQALLYAMVPSLLMNLYITGLNQITDVEIDKINKPNLPLPAKLLSRRAAVVTVLVALIVSLAMAVAPIGLATNGLSVALFGSCILGTLYSLPPFRLKRFHLLAAFCIVAVRGAIINAGFFAHAQAAAYGNAGATVLSCLTGDKKCLLSSLFFGIFGIVIALMKDVPDVEGDRTAKINTFSVRVGQQRVFHAARHLLQLLFGAVGAGFLRGAVVASAATCGVAVRASRAFTGVAAFLVALSVRKEAALVDPEDKTQVYSYYMHLWKLFYLSYIILPFAR